MTQSAAVERHAEASARLRWPRLLAVAVAIVIVAGYAVQSERFAGTPDRLDPQTLKAGYGPASYSEALALTERSVVAVGGTLAVAPDEWLRGEVLARALLARWRLAGDYADLAQAQRIVDRGLLAAPYPSGPVLTSALLAGLTHQLTREQAALDRMAKFALPDAADKADGAALAGDIAVQKGDLASAARSFAEAERIAPTPGITLRRVVLESQRGDQTAAIAGLEALLAKPRQRPEALAGLMLQRANLAYATGDWVEAGRWVGAAQRTFRGWWLADAYAAQQFALAGRTDQAIEAYDRVARRSGRPEVMDALAHLFRLQGDAAQSRAWAARAARGWADRGALFPEAVAHHRAEHELSVGSAAAAFAYARADAAARPQAPNLVILARALIAAGRPREALRELDRADAQGWVSANQALARAEAAGALGDTAGRDAALARAEAINSRAADPRMRMIWFGHD